jgi:hypothetical protein
MSPRSRTTLLASLALAAALWGRPAGATVRLGLGADYWFDPEIGSLQLTLSADTPLARRTTIGGRFGVLVTSGPDEVAVPIDLQLRVRGRRLYFEGLVGPWIFFDGDALRLHAALGFGLLTRGGMSFGLEVGWVDPTAVAGVRLAFRL